MELALLRELNIFLSLLLMCAHGLNSSRGVPPARSQRVPAPTHRRLNSLGFCELVAKPTGTLKICHGGRIYNSEIGKHYKSWLSFSTSQFASTPPRMLNNQLHATRDVTAACELSLRGFRE